MIEIWGMIGVGIGLLIGAYLVGRKQQRGIDSNRQIHHRLESNIWDLEARIEKLEGKEE